MGRTEPSLGRPPAGFRRDARAKKAKATVNKVIPSLLSAHPRARKGIQSAELIVDPPSTRSRDGDGGKNGAVTASSRRVSKSEPKSAGSGEEEARARMRITMRLADTLVVAHSLLSCSSSSSSSSSITNEEKKQKKQTKQQQQQQPDLANREARVGILNMASPLSPGGGFLNGAAAQEESLCMRTTLLPSLRDEFYRLPELGAVYTPDVLVFRGEKDGAEDLPKKDRWFVDCISAAMLRIPETQEVGVDEAEQQRGHDNDNDDDDDDDDDDDEYENEDRNGDSGEGPPVVRKIYADPKDRELAIQKMRVVLRIAQAKGIRRLVLGAWGCGAYGNPVEEIAAAWKKILLGSSNNRGPKWKGKGKKNSGKKEEETWDGIEEVVFAIKGGGIAERFERAFGDGLVREEDAEGSHGGDGDEDAGSQRQDSLEEMRLRELREKIQQLELQIQQARTPQMQSGLGSVLAGLRCQLPEDGISSNEHGPSGRDAGNYGDKEDEEDDENDEIGGTAGESHN